MRRIVIAKMLILALWSLYLGIALSQPSEKEFKHAAGEVRPDDKESSPSSPHTKFRQREAAYFCPAASMIRFAIVSGCDMLNFGGNAGLLEHLVGM